MFIIEIISKDNFMYGFEEMCHCGIGIQMFW
jgi:hypothetical protein